jgi:hypothetical protein
MNVNITGIYDNTVIVDTNLFEDVRLLQTGLSSLSDTLFNVVEGLPNQYANLTAFTNLSNNYDSFKISNTSNLSNISLDIDNLTTSLSTLNTDITNNFVNNTSLTTLSTAIDNQFELTTTYIDNQLELTTTCIDEKITEQHEYTDQEIPSETSSASSRTPSHRCVLLGARPSMMAPAVPPSMAPWATGSLWSRPSPPSHPVPSMI